MNLFQAFLLALVEGFTEFLPVSSTAHIGFIASLMGVQETQFLKFFQVSIQFGAILAVVFVYWRHFFDFKNLGFYVKLLIAVLPALVLGKLFNEKIEEILSNQIAISIVLILGGIILLFVDRWFKNPKIHDEKQITGKKAFIVGFWQCLAMMPGTSRSAASIIGGMTQGLSRKLAAEFSFFLAVPTMAAATLYSIFIKEWRGGEDNALKGYEILLSSGDNMAAFLLGNLTAFLVALLAIKSFITLLNRFGFRMWGWYRIIVGSVLLMYFSR